MPEMISAADYRDQHHVQSRLHTSFRSTQDPHSLVVTPLLLRIGLFHERGFRVQKVCSEHGDNQGSADPYVCWVSVGKIHSETSALQEHDPARKVKSNDLQLYNIMLH